MQIKARGNNLEKGSLFIKCIDASVMLGHERYELDNEDHQYMHRFLLPEIH